jgi:hypothetical protein
LIFFFKLLAFICIQNKFDCLPPGCRSHETQLLLRDEFPFTEVFVDVGPGLGYNI